jgi:membrane associated rhomboid family serine protease
MTEPMANPAVPVCPRHLDRVSYVRCQRCGRPTCPECQRPAAVGVQCVDCVREGQRSVRAPRTQFGAAVRDGRPVVTLTIIGICTAVWLLQQVSPTVTQELSFAPYQGVSEPWRFLTAAFAHAQGQPLHILFNMFALYQIGSYLEPMLGRVRFASLYLISALGGSVGYLLLATPPGSVEDLRQGSAWVIGTVGASGAVFGLFAALLVLNRHLGRSSAGIVVVLAINAVLGFVIPGIAWQAHLGGAITGAVLAALITVTAPRPRQRLQLPALAVAALIVIGLAVAKYALTDQTFMSSIQLVGG